MTNSNRNLIRLRMAGLPERQRQRDKDRQARIDREAARRARLEMARMLEMEVSGYGISFCREWLRDHGVEFTERAQPGFTEIIAQPGVSLLFNRQGDWARYRYQRVTSS